jgi:hypothetical protein
MIHHEHGDGLFAYGLPTVDVSGGLVVVAARANHFARLSEPSPPRQRERMDVTLMAVKANDRPRLDSQEEDPRLVI